MALGGGCGVYREGGAADEGGGIDRWNSGAGIALAQIDRERVQPRDSHGARANRQFFSNTLDSALPAIVPYTNGLVRE